MKKTLITAVAVLALAAPFATAQPERRDQQQQYQQGQQDSRDGRDGQNARDRHDGQDARNDGPSRDRHGRRQNWRDSRHDARWDDSRHNGYYDGGRWHYGPPPQSARNVQYGYRQWSRGQRLGYYQSRYQEVDYRGQRGLRRPPRGYHWVRDNDGDYLLAAIATGVILSVVLSSR